MAPEIKTREIGETLEVTIKCIQCEQEFKLVLKKSDYQDWQNGKLAQRAFPYLSAGQRELLISGICSNCYDDLFGVEEE